MVWGLDVRFNMTFYFHWVFGAVLVYSGIKIIALPELQFGSVAEVNAVEPPERNDPKECFGRRLRQTPETVGQPD
eukprot:2833954-Amphidinium_carterae.1